MKTKLNLLLLFLALFFVISCKKAEDAKPEIFCFPMTIGNDSNTQKYAYDANNKVMSGEVDGLPFKFEYTGNNVTKVTYSNADATRVILVEYDAQNRPSKAKKTYSSKDFNYIQDFLITYDANGRLSTERVEYQGGFAIVMLHRLEYDANGNVLKHFVKENTNAEFLFVENTGFDGKKNVNRSLKLNPINLFYEPLNLFDSQSESNQTTVKTRVKNSEYLGSVYNIDIKYAYSAYNENGYPTAGTQDFTIEHDDFNDPTSTKTVVDKGSYKLNLAYLCK